jgi:hypothetical protein
MQIHNLNRILFNIAPPNSLLLLSYRDDPVFPESAVSFLPPLGVFSPIVGLIMVGSVTAIAAEVTGRLVDGLTKFLGFAGVFYQVVQGFAKIFTHLFYVLEFLDFILIIGLCYQLLSFFIMYIYYMYNKIT